MTSGCLDESDVLDFIDGALRSERAADIERHIYSCSVCRSLVADVAKVLRPHDPAAAPDAPAPLPPATQVLRYEIEATIGVGGGGVIYRAFDPRLQRRVALKLISPSSSSGSAEEAQQRLLREAQAMAQLSHFNVLQVHDAGAFGDQVFIVMELVEGETLAQWLARRRPSWREVIRTFLDAGRGLAATHAAGIVHRDFKPSNVLMDTDGRVRVADFGLATLGDGHVDDCEPSAGTSRPGVTAAAGTPIYMAPEQFEGSAADARSDQFSFCVALWMAIFGRHPFTGETLPRSLPRLREAMKSAVPRPPPDTDVPAAVSAALARGMRRQPEERFPGIDELLAALTRAASLPRRRRLAALVVAGALLVSGLGVAAVVGRPRCGDGQVDAGAGEQCDDGNRSSADGCLDSCRWARCGDGQVRASVETCDDSNGIEGDGCSATCSGCSGGDGAFAWRGNGHCYTRHDRALTFAQARAVCWADDHGDLATPISQPEGAVLGGGLLRGRSATLWIGLYRSEVARDTFTWVTGERFERHQMLFWAEGEPRDGSNCAFVDPTRVALWPGGKLAGTPTGVAAWGAAACDERRPFVCERSPWVLRPENNHAYRLLTGKMTHGNARRACQQLGAHLVTVSEVAEESFVAALARQTVWLGADDQVVEGRFQWDTGEPFAFQRFAPGEPDDDTGHNDCIALGFDNLWHDRACWDENASVCEID